MVGTGGLVAESHPATEQLAVTTAYRYTGANPDNYVSFNNELWRIIGIFDVDDGTGNIEQRIKLIRNESIGTIKWDTNNINDWSKSTGMKLLNSGAYWNRTGSYAKNGLTEEAKSLIANAKWYLGGVTSSSSAWKASYLYEYERGTTVYDSTRPTSWVGKVGLMYPSDYGYATSGGFTTNRESCLAKSLGNWISSSVSDCKNNDWLYDSSNDQWTLTHNYGYSSDALRVNTTGYVDANHGVSNVGTFCPSIYLKCDIRISGSGTSDDPYILSR